jgi:hypothetical protein
VSDESREVDEAVAQIQAASDEEALRLEAELLQSTGNSLQPGDPDDQPPLDEPLGTDRPDLGPIAAPGTATLGGIITRFESQLGITEQPAGSNNTVYCSWYGLRGPWCAMFVSWCFHEEGMALPASTSKGFAYTPSGASWFKGLNQWTSKPAPGHVVFFDFPNDGVNRISHVGLVTAANIDGSIDTIEGNTDERGGRTGGKVMRRRRSSGIVGYGVPKYAVAPASFEESESDRIRQLQKLVGTTADGAWGPQTIEACGRNMIGWTGFVKVGSHASLRGNANRTLVVWLKKQLNRRFGLGLSNSVTVGPAVNHGIVTFLRQTDGICGPNGFREVVR